LKKETAECTKCWEILKKKNTRHHTAKRKSFTRSVYIKLEKINTLVPPQAVLNSKIFKSLILTSLKVHRYLLPIFIEEIGIYPDSRTIYMNILCGKNAELFLEWNFT